MCGHHKFPFPIWRGVLIDPGGHYSWFKWLVWAAEYQIASTWADGWSPFAANNFPSRPFVFPEEEEELLRHSFPDSIPLIFQQTPTPPTRHLPVHYYDYQQQQRWSLSTFFATVVGRQQQQQQQQEIARSLSNCEQLIENDELGFLLRLLLLAAICGRLGSNVLWFQLSELSFHNKRYNDASIYWWVVVAREWRRIKGCPLLRIIFMRNDYILNFRVVGRYLCKVIRNYTWQGWTGMFDPNYKHVRVN